MVIMMGIKHHRSSSFITDNQDDPQSSSDSPLSCDDSRATATTGPSPKKSRRSIKKRVVKVPTGEVEGSRSKGEAYPPFDSWAWRKYGQKPIKGSPYPRGYYRCSSSKGCPARKQVERCRVDPTMLIVTYACEHNHPLPTSKHHHHHHHTAAIANAVVKVATPPTPSAVITTTSEDSLTNSIDDGNPASPVGRINLFGDPPQLEFIGDSLLLGNIGIEYSWISDVSFDMPSFVNPAYNDVDVVTFPMKEEDEFLFGDLDELPECSTVFQQRIERCSTTSPLCHSTG